MKCPWPALRVARAMRSGDAVTIEADDPIAPAELETLALQQGWTFAVRGAYLFAIARPA